MINSINEDYCSFEVSKLLKEKGFDVRCQSWYTEDKEVHYNFSADQSHGWANRNCPQGEYTRPTHAVAIKWIRENFGICFEILFQGRGNGFTHHKIKIYKASNGLQATLNDIDKETEIQNWSPKEATEAALSSVLKNLIK